MPQPPIIFQPGETYYAVVRMEERNDGIPIPMPVRDPDRRRTAVYRDRDDAEDTLDTLQDEQPDADYEMHQYDITEVTNHE